MREASEMFSYCIKPEVPTRRVDKHSLPYHMSSSDEIKFVVNVNDRGAERKTETEREQTDRERETYLSEYGTEKSSK